MIHTRRIFSVTPLADLAILVDRVTTQTWPRCTGFLWENLLLLNDSFSEDGAQEYTVVRDGQEIESLTVSWMTPDTLTATLTALATSPIVTIYGRLQNILETPAQHHCQACA